ncbi:zinc-binding alcohol dehydrogenase family protein [Amycolatopsis sp. PS_44_ISF1]|uniref:quinone oxidoreductase family protein n=1 Tax=Amycolatopsis sp. PS_44_ISF1 TaxID=2974917 RepID=UPI0028DF81A0|nr:zinc-binding alcohol dehydrogenase family protein [Amycolatopsis sp. PS_44_ISF1]MDT8913616.1 zinc-binding alcohol dehydrogenase family protein [Amycolatopsis sp. PS_44_ISF1]
MNKQSCRVLPSSWWCRQKSLNSYCPSRTGESQDMRAIQYNRFGGYDTLESATVPEPVPAQDQAVVRMTLAGINPLDNTVRSGKLPAAAVKDFPIRPGGFGVGVIDNPGGSDLPAGTRVVISGGRYGVGVDGTWADAVAVDPEHLLAVPDAVDDVAAAALTTGAGYLTAYLALTELAGFTLGSAVLAPGVGGAVGQGGVEVATVLGASHAITTATSTAKAEQGRARGYQVIDLSQESLKEGVARLTGGTGVDIVLDGVGGPLTGEALGALARGGRLISIGYAAGPHAMINVTDLIWKSASIHGFQFARFTAEQVNTVNRTLLELVENHRIDPVVDRVFPLDQAAEAARHLSENGPFGRVLLKM